MRAVASLWIGPLANSSLIKELALCMDPTGSFEHRPSLADSVVKRLNPTISIQLRQSSKTRQIILGILAATVTGRTTAGGSGLAKGRSS
jgi:hypothetical protein